MDSRQTDALLKEGLTGFHRSVGRSRNGRCSRLGVGSARAAALVASNRL